MLTEGLVVVQVCLEVQFHLLGIILGQLVLGSLDRSIRICCVETLGI